MKQFQTVNPYTGAQLAVYERETISEALQKIESFSEMQTRWSELSAEERGERLLHVSERLRQQKNNLALQMCLEMGKPITQATLEIEKCAKSLELFIPLAIPQLAEKKIEAHYKHTIVRPEPYGLVLSIQPWNFPYWQLFRMAAAAWMAGNLVVLKHSDVTAGCAELIEKICQFDDLKLILNLKLSHEDTAEIIKSDAIHMVTLTGSTRAGQEVGAVAGAALKKQIFELGGSDAYIVLPDCDLPNAVQSCVKSRLTNSGQSCIAAKRFYIHESIFENFKGLFLKELSQYKMGNPELPETQIGPLATSKFADDLKRQIQKAISKGAKFTSAGIQVEPKPGFADVGVLDFGQELSAFETEEIFGPVASLYKFQDVQQVIKVINRGPYGLGGAVFTRNLPLAKTVSEQMKVGLFAINTTVQSDARAPFGGMKQSGVGRESSAIGLQEFISWKMIGQN